MNSNPAMTHLRNLAIRAEFSTARDGETSNLNQQNYSDSTSIGLTKCIIDFVKLTGGQAEQMPGTSKISVTANGFNGEIDVKIPGDNQDESYQVEIQRLGRSSGLIFQAVDFLSFYYWYNDAFKGKEAEHEI